MVTNIASPKHEGIGLLENSRQLCKQETQSRVCITFENSISFPHVKMRQHKHGKILYCFSKIFLRNTPVQKKKVTRMFPYSHLSTQINQ